MSNHKNAKARATVSEIAADIDITMLTTHAAGGSLRSRPMSHQEANDEGDLWYVAPGDSDIVSEIEANPNVNAALASKSSWLSVAGRATISRSRADLERIWTPSAEAWFPQGIETPGLVAIHVSGDGAEYWDSPGAVATLIQVAVAKVRGQEPQPGTNETVSF